MGTRNLVSVVVDGQTKIAQYSQWDGYPAGTGKDIAKFLHGDGLDLDGFKEKVRGLRWLSSEETKERWAEFGDTDGGWVTMDQASACEKKYPALSRNTGADILGLVGSGAVTEVFDDSEFANDTLFCEWAYTIDLDNESVSVLHGHPKRQVKVISFDEFTPEAMTAFDEEVEDDG